ncbi:MAG TPA: prepilin-type N-terminal cleavage/methylation domain-containing protein, partial [Candidatus Rifleibacterium sp.]|nr:prepilin-type N-terminal cleavage/methylation domain-containing protein [Candidatus Rifleibacterium sp.]
MNAGAATTRHRPDAGVTLIEILIVTVIIALMAALAFPVYKIVQQREKERRLKKILNDVRAAISGGKSQLANTWLSEGFRTYVFQTGKR